MEEYIYRLLKEENISGEDALERLSVMFHNAQERIKREKEEELKRKAEEEKRQERIHLTREVLIGALIDHAIAKGYLSEAGDEEYDKVEAEVDTLMKVLFCQSRKVRLYF